MVTTTTSVEVVTTAAGHQRAVGTRRSVEWGAHSGGGGGEGPVYRVLRALSPRVRVSALRVRASVDAFVYAKPPCKGYRPALWYAVAAVCRISSKHHFRFICIIIICMYSVRCMSVLDVPKTTCVESNNSYI